MFLLPTSNFFLKSVTYLLLIVACCFLFVPQGQAETSEGCKYFENVVTLPNIKPAGVDLGVSKNFHAGDVLIFERIFAINFNHAAVVVDIQDPDGGTMNFFLQSSEKVKKIVIEDPGVYQIDIYMQNSDIATIECVSGSGEENANLVSSVGANLSRIGGKQISDMVSDRMRQLQTGIRHRQVNPVTTSALSYLSESGGDNAGAKDLVSGVWGNIALSHFEDTHRPTDLRGIQGSGILGIDTRLAEQFYVGAAINLEKAYIELGQDQGDISSTGFGISPYLSWQIDDIFSITSASNVSSISSRLARKPGNIITELDVHGIRWHTNLIGDAFLAWDNWSLLSNLTLTYGQLRYFSAKDSNGTHVSGSLSQNGSASVLLQPAYYWQYQDDLALEPYLLSEYVYDFTMQKVSTPTGSPAHPNDQDYFRLGLGVNIFGGRFYSGNIEALTVVGRQKYSETSLSGSLRINF